MKLSEISKQGRKLLLSSLVAGAMLAGMQTGAEAKMGPTGAAIVGGVAGLAVGAAIADAARPKPKPYYYNGYAPPYRPGQYDPYWNQAFRPDPNVTCYPAQRICYNRYGGIADKWTRRVYGY